MTVPLWLNLREQEKEKKSSIKKDFVIMDYEELKILLFLHFYFQDLKKKIYFSFY